MFKKPFYEKQNTLSWTGLFRAYFFLLGKHWKKYLVLVLLLLMSLFESLLPPLILALMIDFFTQFEPGESFTPFLKGCCQFYSLPAR